VYTHIDIHVCTHAYTHIDIPVCTRDQFVSTGLRRPIGSLKLHVIFRKRATNYRALLLEMTCKDKASNGSSPPCIHKHPNTLQHTATHWNIKLIREYGKRAWCFYVLQCVAVCWDVSMCCSVLQMCCNSWVYINIPRLYSRWPYSWMSLMFLCVAVSCSVLYCVAVCCSSVL